MGGERTAKPSPKGVRMYETLSGREGQTTPAFRNHYVLGAKPKRGPISSKPQFVLDYCPGLTSKCNSSNILFSKNIRSPLRLLRINPKNKNSNFSPANKVSKLSGIGVVDPVPCGTTPNIHVPPSTSDSSIDPLDKNAATSGLSPSKH